MKKILSAIAVAAFAMAATADTVVWYDFDGLGEAGTSVSHGTTIQNKANPGTLDATVIGIHHGETAKTADTAHMPVSAVGYPSNYRICDYLSTSVSTNADGAIKFTTPASVSGDRSSNDGGALQVSDTSSELSSETFTLELTIRLDPDEGFVKSGGQTFVCKTITASDNALAWELRWLNTNVCLTWYDSNGTEKNSVWAGDLADGEWHHLAFVVPSGNSNYPLRWYLDYTDKGVSTFAPRSGTGPLTIGARFSGATGIFSNPSRGVSIGEFRYSNAALSADKFLKAHNVPSGTTLAHVKFDDGTVNAAEEYGTLCAGANTAVSGGSVATFSTDVPGARIIDGDGGAVLEKHNAKSLSLSGSQVKWSDAIDTYFLRKTLAGEDLTSWTIEFWMKAAGEQAQWARAFGTLINGSFSSPSYGLSFNSASTITLRAANNSFQINPGASATICDGKWHHIAIVVAPNAEDSSKSDVKLHVDYGSDNGGYTGTATNATLLKHPNNVNFFLGNGAGSASFSGLIDELRISAGALTPSQFLRAEKALGLSIFVR